MNNLSTSDIKNIKEKLVKFKNELFSNNNNNKIKKDPNESKDIKYIRYLFNEDKNKKSDPYKAEKIKNLVAKKLKIIKGHNKYKGIKDIRYLFNDNIYKGIKYIRYLFNEDYYVKNLDSKSEFNKLSNNLIKHMPKILNMWWIILITAKNLQKDPLIQKILEINLQLIVIIRPFEYYQTQLHRS